jgi:hypothetical protein
MQRELEGRDVERSTGENMKALIMTRDVPADAVVLRPRSLERPIASLARLSYMIPSTCVDSQASALGPCNAIPSSPTTR